MKDKKYSKVSDLCHYIGEYRGAVYIICNLKNSVTNKIPITFHIGSNYGYYFDIKELAEGYKKQWKIYKLYSSNRKRRYSNW